jgi:Ser/Thr protein kinase RdoA (MazF antagonist)
MQSFVDPFREVALPDNDLVHGALLPENILTTGDRVNVLIDVDEIGYGSRFHDLATLIVALALESRETTALDVLLSYARAGADRGELEVSVAACLVARLVFELDRRPDNAGRVISTATRLLRSWSR